MAGGADTAVFLGAIISLPRAGPWIGGRPQIDLVRHQGRGMLSPSNTTPAVTHPIPSQPPTGSRSLNAIRPITAVEAVPNPAQAAYTGPTGRRFRITASRKTAVRYPAATPMMGRNLVSPSDAFSRLVA